MKKELSTTAVVGVIVVVVLIVGGVVMSRLLAPPAVPTASKSTPQAPANPEELARKYGYKH